MKHRTWLLFSAFIVACGGPQASPAGGAGDSSGGEDPPAASEPAQPADTFGPLEHGADYASYQKMTTEAHVSPTHGNRFVEIYVNEIGAAAYKAGDDSPVGTVIVKTSWEATGGQKTDVAGPIFVMRKMESGFDEDNSDWWYALHWDNVPESWQAKLGGEKVYWKSPSKKVGYCSGCHNNYPGEVGLPKKGFRVWEQVDDDQP